MNIHPFSPGLNGRLFEIDMLFLKLDLIKDLLATKFENLRDWVRILAFSKNYKTSGVLGVVPKKLPQRWINVLNDPKNGLPGLQS